MNRKLPLLGSMVLAAAAAWAAPLTPEQALERALGTPEANRAPALNRDFSLAATIQAPDAEQAAVYVFAGRNNYMIVSADTQAPAVLGYSDDKGNGFDPDNMAPNMRWWLGQYAAEIGHLRANSASTHVKLAPESRADEDFAPIEPLVKTEWNQDSPYNDLCPELNGRRTFTGCVATAIAQVMSVHRWPPKGVGSRTYVSKDPMGSGVATVSFNFDDTPFDWDNILNTYTSGSYTPAQGEAVAQLMLGVGVAATMQYGLQASGTTESEAGMGMIKYLRYDKGMRWEMRSTYFLADWQKLVYDELAAGRPVPYGGMSEAGGHEFVCDGYQGDGYYHFNWGWGGVSNGYFLLTALNPEVQGIGGSGTLGFNNDQTILSHVMPEQANSQAFYNWTAMGFSTDSDEYRRSSNRKVTVSGPFYNLSLSAYNGSLALGVFESETSTQVKEVFGVVDASNDPMAGAGGLSLSSQMFPEGTYYVFPVYKDAAGNWQPMRANLENGVARLMIESTSSTLKVTKCATPQDPSVLSIVSALKGWSPADKELVAGQEYSVTFDITASQDVSQEFRPAIIYLSGQSARMLATATGRTLNLKGGETATEAFKLKVPVSASTSRTYYLVNTLVTDEGLQILGDPVEVKIVKEGGIDAVATDGAAEVVGRYDLLGRPVVNPVAGSVVIEKLSDGSSRRVLIR